MVDAGDAGRLQRTVSIHLPPGNRHLNDPGAVSFSFYFLRFRSVFPKLAYTYIHTIARDFSAAIHSGTWLGTYTYQAV